jgi:hypothetical protein
MFVQAGVFPFDPEFAARFQDFFAETVGNMSHIAVWGNFGEAATVERLAPTATLLDRTTLEPHKLEFPWTRALAGKRVAVITPFADSVMNQYEKRHQVWALHPDMLPDFSLRTVRTPFSPGIAEPQEKDWFERLDLLTDKLFSEPFDVCLVGAGALSLPLAVRCAKAGKIGIHTGGYTQIMFGIWGRRWDHEPTLTKYKNDAWTRPRPEETPENYVAVDNASYW